MRLLQHGIGSDRRTRDWSSQVKLTAMSIWTTWSFLLSRSGSSPAVRAVRDTESSEPADHASGRSRGGFSTKLHLVAAVGGKEVLPVAIDVGLGQRHETKRIVPLLESLDAKGMIPEKSAGDEGYSARWIRTSLLGKAVEPVIPHQKSEAGRSEPFDRQAYRERNLIERGINLLKWFRRAATRYEKLAVHPLGMLKLAILYRFYLK